MSPSSMAPSRIGRLLVVVLGAVVALGGALSGLVAAQPRAGGTYEVAYDLSPFTLDAMADTISAKSHIVNNVQEGLRPEITIYRGGAEAFEACAGSSAGSPPSERREHVDRAKGGYSPCRSQRSSPPSWAAIPSRSG